MENILDDHVYQNEEQQFQLAGKGKRFANYIIDNMFYGLLSVTIGMLRGTPQEVEVVDFEFGSAYQELIFQLVYGISFVVAFYALQEYLFKGKTIAKFLTNTRAVTESNKVLSFDKALVRSLCRLIPFEAFSFLGETSVGWHDSIPKTRVIEDDKWEENNLLLEEE